MVGFYKKFSFLAKSVGKKSTLARAEFYLNCEPALVQNIKPCTYIQEKNVLSIFPTE